MRYDACGHVRGAQGQKTVKAARIVHSESGRRERVGPVRDEVPVDEQPERVRHRIIRADDLSPLLGRDERGDVLCTQHFVVARFGEAVHPDLVQ